MLRLRSSQASETPDRVSTFRRPSTRNSTGSVQSGAGKAATRFHCPTGFNCLAVLCQIPTSELIRTLQLMAFRKERSGSDRLYDLWLYIHAFGYFMENNGTPGNGAEEILLRSRRRRGVSLSYRG